MTVKLKVCLTFKVSAQVLQINDVLGCGDVHGVLEILVDENVEEHRKAMASEKIESLLSELGFLLYTIKYMCRDVEYYACCGDEVGRVRTGTLGAFAEVFTDVIETDAKPASSNLETKITTQDPVTVALISKHVAEAQPNSVLYHGDDCLADIQNPTLVTEDIAAAIIRDNFRSQCKQMFKRQSGDTKTCTVYDFKHPTVNVCEKNIHLWGAKSKPGLGKVVSCSYNLSILGNSQDDIFIILKDRQRTLPLCKPGDSGAVVVFDEPENPSMFAICMLMGKLSSHRKTNSKENQYSKVEENRYIGLKLQYGINILSLAHNRQYTFLTSS